MVSLSSAVYVDANTLIGVISDPELLADDRAISNSLYNIVTTPLGTRYRIPEYGSALLWLLKEPLDNITAFQIEASLVQAIERWEPRVRIIREQTKVTPNLSITGFDIVLTYYIPRTNKVTNLSLTVRKP